MAEKPTTILSSSLEHRGWSMAERLLGSRKTIAGGELYVFRPAKTKSNHDMTIEIITQYPLAADSPDHIMPHGTRTGGNITDPLFLDKLNLLFKEKEILRVLDLGCSGGLFVKELNERGYVAIGIEGSNWSKETQRGAWNIIPKFLFVADITKPFTILENGQPMKFDVITSWEVLEHIKTEDIPQTLQNVKNHLKDDGLFINSIDTRTDVINGVVLHQTVQPEKWWLKTIARQGLVPMPTIHKYFGAHYLFKSSVGFNVTASPNPERAPSVPKESLRKKIFEKWIGSAPQKILKRILTT